MTPIDNSPTDGNYWKNGKIYALTNKINGKVYVGKTINSMAQRITKHKSANKTPIQKAINKYGINSFDVSILEYVNTDEGLNEREYFWICELNTRSPLGYNLTDGGEGCHNPSPETREKLREARKHLTDESRKKMSDWRKGIVYSEETRKRMSEAKKGHITSPEHRLKLSIANKGKPSNKKGTVASDETKIKQSIANRGKIISIIQRNKISAKLMGHSVSEITRNKISISLLKNKNASKRKTKKDD